MKNHYPRKMLPPGTSRKRKHTDSTQPAKPKDVEPIKSNRLLAGYLAHEFLTKGTLSLALTRLDPMLNHRVV
ncbi:hypothetical protein Lalb_Chr06g0169251 [Lupinus albus]|uniref:Uncharacterized protein n=1 Tax=Lupinus albus TaxID=3870 RepID=A0A6A4QDR2_LUPAL|nr:hypothetical protein Lalb_Chr06g0169251 [Lupinus albus]